MNKLKLVVMFFTITILITGCTKTPEEIVNEVVNKMDEVNTYHMSTDMELEIISEDGSGYIITAKQDGDMDQKNRISKYETETSFFGQKYETKNYEKYDDEKIIQYIQENDIWYKKESADNDFDYDIIKAANNIELIENEKNTYKMIVSKDEVPNFLNAFEDSEEADEESIFKNPQYGDLEMTITIDNDYITKMTIKLPIQSDDYSINCSITMELSQFNEIESVTIPNYIYNKAVDIQTYNKLLNIRSYYEIIKQYIDYYDLYEGTITYKEFEYGGPMPDNVDVNYNRGNITDGIIEIEGYRGIITNGVLTYETNANDSL